MADYNPRIRFFDAEKNRSVFVNDATDKTLSDRLDAMATLAKTAGFSSIELRDAATGAVLRTVSSADMHDAAVSPADVSQIGGTNQWPPADSSMISRANWQH